MQTYFIFVLASRHHRHLSIDVCVDLRSGVKRARQRVNRHLGRRRALQKLVYVESIRDLEQAVARHGTLLRMDRARLDVLISSVNPGWDPLSSAI
ncbi:MAG: hypothetical protein O2780_10175 [Proteobacteria bacterium]|nr:hypothetical protein [Pseudomonadota bacterium]